MPTLEWIGKDKVVNHHLEVPYRVLEEQYTYNADRSDNMIIRGDNLEALKALLPRYEGKVKCIYIDPPYNTGNEGWVYNDNVNDPRIKKWLGEVVGKEGEDLSRHDKWLCMMYPRLKLLHRLLAEDGVIFISIDDTEFSYLKLICDEIFRNFAEAIVWQKRTSPDARKKLSSGHEYVLIYTKNPDQNLGLKLLPLEGRDAEAYTNPDDDPRGPWISSPFTAPGYRPNQMYSITTPTGKTMIPPKGRCWCNIEEVYQRLLSEGRMWFGADGNGVPRRKTYLSEREGRGVWTWWTNSEVGYTQIATQELAAILGKAVFDYPKPVRLISRIIQMASSDGDIILDSFAGSGTTAHAVLNMNKADGGHRKFILVEMMDYAETITAERVKQVIDGYGQGKNAVEGTSGDFTFYELGPVLLLSNGNLNEDVGAEKIREYVYFMETKSTIDPTKEDEPYYMGVHLDSAYYFYYERDSLTTLSRDFLGSIKTKAGRYTIYADQCTLSQAELERWHITFKKIPRDISKL